MLVWALHLACAAVALASASEELHALRALYDGTQGAQWALPANAQRWEGADACSWFGVTCCGGTAQGLPRNSSVLLVSQAQALLATCTGGRAVAAVQLADVGLVGSLPGEISLLRNLRLLDLSRNPGARGVGARMTPHAQRWSAEVKEAPLRGAADGRVSECAPRTSFAATPDTHNSDTPQAWTACCAAPC